MMANEQENTKWNKKNTKLESFLKWALPRDVYDTVRFYEICIVQSPGKSLGVRYLILSDKTLYFTQNPPKSILEVIKFQHIDEIKLIHDNPDFIREEDKKHCQHICINYHEQQQQIWKERTENRLLRIWDPRSKSKTDDKRDSTDTISATETSISDDVTSYNSSQVTSQTGSIHNGRRSATESPILQTSSFHLGVPSSLHGRSRAMTPEPTIRSNNSSHSANSEELSALFDRLEDSSEPRLPRSISVLDKPRPQIIPPRRPFTVMEGPTKLQNLPNNRLFYDSYDSSVQAAVKKMHIYILNSLSPAFFYVQNAYNSSIIIETLKLEDDCTGLFTNRENHRPNKNLERVYEKFKRDVQNPSNSIERTYQLLSDLQQEADKNYGLKEIFWKDQSIFHFLLRILHEMQPCGIDFTNGSLQINVENRADQLELIILCLTTLRTVFNDTDTLQSKVQMLKFNQGSIIQNLLSLLFHVPEIPVPFRNTCYHMLGDYHQFVSTGWENLPEAELIRLMAEVVNATTMVIYEVFITVQQFQHKRSCFNLAKLLERIKVEKYLTWSSCQLLRILFPQKSNKITPIQAILIYKNLYVIEFFLESVSRIQEFLKNTYEEEFRYYLHRKGVSNKIPDEYPIKAKILQLVDKTSELALKHKKCNAIPSYK